MADDDLKARFFRERRLLLALSLILLAHQLLGITVGKAADAAGLHFEVDKPERIFIAVWVIWTWTFICYAQQLNTLKLRAQFPMPRYEEIRRARTSRILLRHIRSVVGARYQEEIPRRLQQGFEVVVRGRTNVGPGNAPGEDYLVVDVNRHWRNPPSPASPLTIKPFLTTLNSTMKGWISAQHGDSKSGDKCSATETLRVPIGGRDNSLWVWLPAKLRIYFSMSYSTDFIAPIVVGLAPLLILIYHVVAARIHSLT